MFKLINYLLLGIFFLSTFGCVSSEPTLTIDKPAIYLYPLKKQYIDVNLSINGKIIKSIPDYNNGWYVLVDTNGTIESKYDYLFYENTLKKVSLPKEGWIKESKELAIWFDGILKELGLNDKETMQFKEYWLERLKGDKLYKIKLFTRDFLDKNMTLIVSPKPDTTIRVIFSFEEITKKESIKEPIIITPKRVGFTLLEWGGMIL